MGVVHEGRLVGSTDWFKTNIHYLLTSLIMKVTVCHAIPPLLTKDDTNLRDSAVLVLDRGDVMRRALGGLFPGRWAQKKTFVDRGNYLESNNAHHRRWQGERMGAYGVRREAPPISSNTLSP
jgi:hypothetical protein